MADFYQFLTIFCGIHGYGASVYKGMGGKSMGVGWLVAKIKTKKQDDTYGRVYTHKGPIFNYKA